MITLERQSVLSQEITAAESRPRWLQAIQNVAKEFGFTHASLMRVPHVGDNMLADALMETTLPVRFIREFDAMGLLCECPVLASVKASLIPLAWFLSDLDTGDPAAAPIMDLLTQYGLANGIVIPTGALNGERYLMRFDGKCDRLSQAAMNELGMIALHAFDAYERIRRAEMVAPRTLTKRELEVIHWTSQGKTSAEIGQILSLSDHTINAYLNNAIRKLDCVNRTQLVAKAIRLKLIS